MPTQLIFSNNIETLACALTSEIDQHHDPFEPITIIVPNPYVQKWIQLKIAGVHGITMNVTFRFLNDGLWEILDYLNPLEKKPSTLEQKDIQLMLYHSIARIDPGNSHVTLITEYLFNNDKTRSSGYDHKIWQLSSRLSRYFMEYELYREDMIQSWIEGKLLLKSDMESAQQNLYCTLFKQGGYRDIIKKNWFTLPQYWNVLSSKPSVIRSRKLILFSESHLSPFHARLIFEIGKYLTISIYQVNPCSEFWEDITTPREDRWEQIRSIHIEKTDAGDDLIYNDDENPLLKFWGKTGRETIKLLSLIEEAGSREQRCTSEWILPDQTMSDAASLSIVQNQILRRTTWKDASATINQDTSIQIASCPEIFRETESVFNSILYNLISDITLKMTDIAIMVPDMAAYGPVIHSVFSREPRRLSYSIIDSTAATDSLFAKALLSIIEIAAGSFTRKEISALVRNPCFFEAHSMTLNDALVWLSWADKLHIFHYFNKTDEIDPEQNLYTWQQGLQRIRFGRIMNAKESSIHDGAFLDYKNVIPFSDINTGDQHLIDAISSTIELLHYKTKNLFTIEAPAVEWVRIIKGLITDFLTIPAEKQEEIHVYSSLIDDLNNLAILDRLPNLNNTPLLSLTAIKEFIVDTLTDIPSTRGSYLTSGINISALVPKRQIPFRIIYVMGMQEGIFPGSSDTSTLNLMINKRRIGDTTRPDVNRYHFLETLLAAKEKLYITFISKDLQKDQDFHPNSVIGQLTTYLNNYVIKDDFIITEVPSSGSSMDYVRYNPTIATYSDFIHTCINSKFQPVNYNKSDRLVLLHNVSRTYILNNNITKLISQQLDATIPDFSLSKFIDIEHSETETISLNDLRTYIYNPVESTLRWHLSMYEDKIEDAAMQENEPFFSVYPDNYSFIINSLNYFIRYSNVNEIQSYINDYYRHIKLMSITPDGAFGDIDYENLNSDILNRFENNHGLMEFLHARNNFISLHTIIFGHAQINNKPDKVFQSVICPINQNNTIATAELNGSIPVLWKHPDTGNCETIVVTNSTKPTILNLINPFLFYVVSASNYNKRLGDFVGSGPFTIHISHQKGISSYTFHLSETECKEFVQRLLNDFLNTEDFDLLPLPILSDPRIKQPSNMKELPDEAEMMEYRQSLKILIEVDAEKMIPVYRPMAILELIDAEVPMDAYIKVRDRLGLLFKLFAGGTSS